jgi:pimeloyl-ACP methyl ester carboxylesterase
LITFDKRGAGLSDAIPTSALPSLDVLTEDIPAILDAAGSESAALIANLGSGILAIDFAAAHPERVSSLVLVDSFARFLVAPDFPIGAPRALLDETLERRRRAPGVVTVRTTGVEPRNLDGDGPAHVRERRS